MSISSPSRALRLRINDMAFSYNGCPCGGTFESRFIDVTFRQFNPPVKLARVPQGVCPKCGSRVYKAEIMDLLESVMRGKRQRDTTKRADDGGEIASSPAERFKARID